MGTYELATILQGEAAVLGVPGMFAIGLCVMARLSLGQSTDSFYGRAEPGHKAWLVAITFQLAKPQAWTTLYGTYPYCLSKQDVKKLRAPPGNIVVKYDPLPQYEIHMYKEWP